MRFWMIELFGCVLGLYVLWVVRHQQPWWLLIVVALVLLLHVARILGSARPPGETREQERGVSRSRGPGSLLHERRRAAPTRGPPSFVLLRSGRPAQ